MHPDGFGRSPSRRLLRVVEVVLLGTWEAPRRRRSASEEARHDRCRASCSRWPARAGSSATTLRLSECHITKTCGPSPVLQSSLIYPVPGHSGSRHLISKEMCSPSVISKEMCSPLESETPIGCGDASQSQCALGLDTCSGSHYAPLLVCLRIQSSSGLLKTGHPHPCTVSIGSTAGCRRACTISMVSYTICLVI